MILLTISRNLALSFRKIVASGRQPIAGHRDAIRCVFNGSRCLHNVSTTANESKLSFVDETYVSPSIFGRMPSSSLGGANGQHLKKLTDAMAIYNLTPSLKPAEKVLTIIKQRPESVDQDIPWQTLLFSLLKQLPNPNLQRPMNLHYRRVYEQCCHSLFLKTEDMRYFQLLNLNNLDINAECRSTLTRVLFEMKPPFRLHHVIQILNAPEGSVLRFNEQFLNSLIQYGTVNNADSNFMVNLQDLKDDLKFSLRRTSAERAYTAHMYSLDKETRYAEATKFLRFILSEISDENELTPVSWACRKWWKLPALKRDEATSPAHKEFISLFDEAVEKYKALLSNGYETRLLQVEKSSMSTSAKDVVAGAVVSLGAKIDARVEAVTHNSNTTVSTSILKKTNEVSSKAPHSKMSTEVSASLSVKEMNAPVAKTSSSLKSPTQSIVGKKQVTAAVNSASNPLSEVDEKMVASTDVSTNETSVKGTRNIMSNGEKLPPAQQKKLAKFHSALQLPVLDEEVLASWNKTYRQIYQPNIMLECSAQFKRKFEKCTQKMLLLAKDDKMKMFYYQALMDHDMRVRLDGFEVICKSILESGKYNLRQHLLERATLPVAVEDRVNVAFVDKLLQFCSDKKIISPQVDVLNAFKSDLQSGTLPVQMSGDRLNSLASELAKSKTVDHKLSVQALNIMVKQLQTLQRLQFVDKNHNHELMRLFTTVMEPSESSPPLYTALYCSVAEGLLETSSKVGQEDFVNGLTELLNKYRLTPSVVLDSVDGSVSPVVPVVSVVVESLTPTNNSEDSKSSVNMTQKVDDIHGSPVVNKANIEVSSVLENSSKTEKIMNDLKGLNSRLKRIDDISKETREVLETRRTLAYTLQEALKLPVESKNLPHLYDAHFRLYQPLVMLECDDEYRKVFEECTQKMLVLNDTKQMLFYQILRNHEMRVPLEGFETICMSILEGGKYDLKQHLLERATLPAAVEDRVNVAFVDKLLQFCSDKRISGPKVDVLNAFKSEFEPGRALPARLPASRLLALKRELNQMESSGQQQRMNRSIEALNLISCQLKTVNRLQTMKKPQFQSRKHQQDLRELFQAVLPPSETSSPLYTKLYNNIQESLNAAKEKVEVVSRRDTTAVERKYSPTRAQFSANFRRVLSTMQQLNEAADESIANELRRVLLHDLYVALQLSTEEFAKVDVTFKSRLVEAYFAIPQPMDLLSCNDEYWNQFEECTQKLLIVGQKKLHLLFYHILRDHAMEIPREGFALVCKSILKEGTHDLQLYLLERATAAKSENCILNVAFADDLIQFCSDNEITGLNAEVLSALRTDLVNGAVLPFRIPTSRLTTLYNLLRTERDDMKQLSLSIQGLNVIGYQLKTINRVDSEMVDPSSGHMLQFFYSAVSPLPSHPSEYKELYTGCLESLINRTALSKNYDEVCNLHAVLTNHKKEIQVHTLWHVAGSLMNTGEVSRLRAVLTGALTQHTTADVVFLVETLISVSAEDKNKLRSVNMLKLLLDDIKAPQLKQERYPSQLAKLNELSSIVMNQVLSKSPMVDNDYTLAKAAFSELQGEYDSIEFKSGMESLSNSLVQLACLHKDWSFAKVVFDYISREMKLSQEAWISACVSLLHLKQYSKVSELYKSLHGEAHVAFDVDSFIRELTTLCREVNLTHFVTDLDDMAKERWQQQQQIEADLASKREALALAPEVATPVRVQSIVEPKKAVREVVETQQVVTVRPVPVLNAPIKTTNVDVSSAKFQKMLSASMGDEIGTTKSAYSVASKEQPAKKWKSDSRRGVADLLNMSDDLAHEESFVGVTADRMATVHHQKQSNKFSALSPQSSTFYKHLKLSVKDSFASSSKMVKNLLALFDKEVVEDLSIYSFEQIVGGSTEDCLNELLRHCRQSSSDTRAHRSLEQLYAYLRAQNYPVTSDQRIELYRILSSSSESTVAADEMFSDLLATIDPLPVSAWIHRINHMIRKGDVVGCFVLLDKLHEAGYSMLPSLYEPLYRHYSEQQYTKGIDAVRRMQTAHQETSAESLNAQAPIEGSAFVAKKYHFTSPSLKDLPTRVTELKKQNLPKFVEQIKNFIMFDTAYNCLHFLNGLNQDNFLMSCDLYVPVMQHYLSEGQPLEAKRLYELMLSHGVVPDRATRRLAMRECGVRLPESIATDSNIATLFDTLYIELESSGNNTQAGWFNALRDLVLNDKHKHAEHIIQSLIDEKFPLTSDHFYPLMLLYFETGSFEDMQRLYSTMIQNRVSVSGSVKRLMLEYTRSKNSAKDVASDPLLTALVSRSSKGREIKDVTLVFDVVYEQLVANRENNAAGWVAVLSEQLSANHLENAVYLLTSMHKAGYPVAADYVAPVMMFCFQRKYFAEFNVLREMIRRYELKTNPSIELMLSRYNQMMKEGDEADRNGNRNSGDGGSPAFSG